MRLELFDLSDFCNRGMVRQANCPLVRLAPYGEYSRSFDLSQFHALRPRLAIFRQVYCYPNQSSNQEIPVRLIRARGVSQV
jgi:hypothetical protein